MKLLSVNIADAKTIQVGNHQVETGIFKQPVVGSISVGPMGLPGDTIVNKKVHGGEDQAIYIYSQADYDWWSDQLGTPLHPGAFGENLTITDFHEGELLVGDRLLIKGRVLLEITAPRVPCAQFSTKMGDKSFGKKFIEAARPGAYARVLQGGEIQVGDEISWQVTDQDFAGVKEIFIEWHRSSWSKDVAQRAINSPISNIAKAIIEKRSGLAS